MSICNYSASIVFGSVSSVLAEIALAPGPSPRSLAGRVIFCVEDDGLIALDLAALLAREGATVLGPFGRLGEASIAARELPYDLALLDINVAGEAVWPVAAIARSRGIPIVFCTGYGSDSPRPEEFRSVTTVLKPFNDADLVAAIAGALVAVEHG